MSNLIGSSQGAELLGVSTRTLVRWEDQGKQEPCSHRRWSSPLWCFRAIRNEKWLVLNSRLCSL